jgi:hypothetical protein
MEDSQNISSMLTEYRYAVGIIVPLVIVAIGVLGKKVARGPGWEYADFYLGNELTLAGVSGTLVNFFDLLKPEQPFGMLQRKLVGANITIAILGLVLYYVALSLRQDYGPESGKSENKQLFFLLVVSNAIGLATLVGALMLMAP